MSEINAKCLDGLLRLYGMRNVPDEKYMRSYSRRYCPIGVYAPIGQTYSQYKDKELTHGSLIVHLKFSEIVRLIGMRRTGNLLKASAADLRLKQNLVMVASITKELFNFVEDGKNNIKLYWH